MPSYTTQLSFAQALSIIRAIPQNSTLQPIASEKLHFYGLYKQATEGDVNTPRPSSRQVVDYAKWKAWSRMKGMSPIKAQKLYVESLIQLLTELVHRYPRHEQTEFLKKALESLQYNSHSDTEHEDEELFQDAYDPTEFELQENFLNHIEADQLMQEDIVNSPPASATASSPFRSTPHHSNHYHNSRHNSFSDIVSTNEYPITPITSPGQNSVTGQWVLNQLQQQKKQRYVHPMDFLQKQQDILSEADTLDREVAAATSNLILSSPRQSPYTISTATNRKKSISKPQHSSPHLSSTSTSASSSKKKQIKSKKSDRALEKLQTEVTALTEQIDRLRRGIKLREDRDKSRKWSTFGVTKVLIKHLMANSAILLIIFYILWRRKSPVAYAIIEYIMPIIQDMIRKIIQRVVFWKVTV
ncbi:acyl CoA binding protein-domain-containing protein [Parasitella parasitica]|nr:acyl CoA binding protein-domain-containing protein [Parasitella parasitica]